MNREEELDFVKLMIKHTEYDEDDKIRIKKIKEECSNDELVRVLTTNHTQNFFLNREQKLKNNAAIGEVL
jgi:hypothetical protein